MSDKDKTIQLVVSSIIEVVDMTGVTLDHLANELHVPPLAVHETYLKMYKDAIDAIYHDSTEK